MKTVGHVLEEIDRVVNMLDKLEMSGDTIGRNIDTEELKDTLHNYRTMLLALPVKQ
jgi:hypothetical protein